MATVHCCTAGVSVMMLLLIPTVHSLIGGNMKKFFVDLNAEPHKLELHGYKTAAKFSLAKHFQSHMVLQQAPQRANIYGFSPDIGAAVTVQMEIAGKVFNYTTTVTQNPTTKTGVWNVTLDPIKTDKPATITVTSEKQLLQIEDVLFGDVWVCSGQSNMQFMVQQIFGGQYVMANATQYPYVRFMNVYREGYPTPLDDLLAIAQNWTHPTRETVGDFSAVCWLYGIHLYQVLGYPIGLIGTDYGGTPVKAWSSPVALAKCGVNNTKSRSSDNQPVLDPYSDEDVYINPSDNSVLWNAMVHPLLGMTIYGAIWYQGEADAAVPDMMNKYNCTFPAMIDDWRHNFHMASSGETSELFPFGFVQLATSMPPQNPGFADIRWHQTADYGYVPNKRLPQVFMAVGLDLPDFDSPSGPVHTRYKQEVGFRLSLSGLAVAYNRNEMFQGPYPQLAYIGPNNSLVVDYGSLWQLDVRNTEGFEVLCTSGNHSKYNWWLLTSIMTYTSTQLSLLGSVCGSNQQIIGLRYNWQTTPCALKTCAVYSTINELPAPPFIAFAKTYPGGKMIFRLSKQTPLPGQAWEQFDWLKSIM